MPCWLQAPQSRSSWGFGTCVARGLSLGEHGNIKKEFPGSSMMTVTKEEGGQWAGALSWSGLKPCDLKLPALHQYDLFLFSILLFKEMQICILSHSLSEFHFSTQRIFSTQMMWCVFPKGTLWGVYQILLRKLGWDEFLGHIIFKALRGHTCIFQPSAFEIFYNGRWSMA
jgi:hypothetical protein